MFQPIKLDRWVIYGDFYVVFVGYDHMLRRYNGVLLKGHFMGFKKIKEVMASNKKWDSTN